VHILSLTQTYSDDYFQGLTTFLVLFSQPQHWRVAAAPAGCAARSPQAPTGYSAAEAKLQSQPRCFQHGA
jgi:hypothetical protein